MTKKQYVKKGKQMNTRYNMIFIRGEIKTAEVMVCNFNADTKKWDVKFNNGKPMHTDMKM